MAVRTVKLVKKLELFMSSEANRATIKKCGKPLATWTGMG